MPVGYIIGYCLFLAVMLTVSIFMYAYGTYCKNRLFTKSKPQVLFIVIFALLALCFAGVGAFFIWHYQSAESESTDLLHIIFCFILVSFCLVYILCFVLITKLGNKNKIKYDQIAKIDWTAKAKALESEIGDLESFKSRLSRKHKKYYRQMLTYYKAILNNAKNDKIPLSHKIADIITFNDSFTHKWSSKINRFQLLLTYQYCQIFSKSLSNF